MTGPEPIPNAQSLAFDDVFAAAPNPYLLLAPDRDFTILGANDAYLRATDKVRDEIVGRGIFSVFPDNPSDPAATGVRNLRASLEEAVRTRKPHAMAVQKYDIRVRSGAFEERHWSPTNVPVLDRDARSVVAIIHYVEDVTESVLLRKSLGREKETYDERRRESDRRLDESARKLARAEQRLALERAGRASEERFRQLADAMPQIVWAARPDGTLDYYNRRWFDFIGVPESRAGDATAWDRYVHPDDGARVAAAWAASRASGTTYEAEFRVRDGRGEYHWFLVRAEPVQDADGRVVRWYGTCTDVDRWKRAEGRAHTILESVTDGFFSLDPDWRFSYVNAAAERFLLRPRGELVGRNIWDEFPAAVGTNFEREYRRAAAGGVMVQFVEYYPPPLDAWYEARAYPSAGGLSVYFQDITERRRAEQALGEAKQRLELALDAGELGTFHCPMPLGEIVWNEKCCEHFFIPPDANVNFDLFYALLHPDDRERTRDAVERAVLGRTGYDVQYRTVARDGRTRWIRAKGRAYYDDAGNPTRFDGVTIDVTDAKALEAEREALLASERAARGEAERASRMKDEFLATLSHELRTPLNAILGWSQILRGGRSPDEVSEGLGVIERNARAQTQIIEDLLDMSRIISGKIRLDVQRVDLATVVASAVETVKPAAAAKGVRFQTVLDPRAGPVSGDPNRLQQVFWNLLTNAVKFTPRGGRVQVLLERVNSHLEVNVIDTGDGIKPEFLPHVFDRFRQADGSTTRRHGGLGLGLSIVKQLVELHGGGVRAKSGGAGAGSTFTVSLPLTVIHPEPEPPRERRHPGAPVPGQASVESCAALDGLRVLVVDDEPDARDLVRRFLEDCRAVVVTAASAGEAVERITGRPPDVLVTDIGMPGEDGYALIRRVRALPPDRGGNVPAVALTAYARAEDRVRAMMSGFQQHVAKPVEPSELIAVIAILSGRMGRSTGGEA